jgi:hypothetical protein
VELFFCVCCSQDSNAELAISGGGGCVVIHIMSGQGVNSYFDIHMPKSINGWQKQWFYLRNDADALLPVFTGNRPTPHHNWRYGVAKNDLDKL